MPDFSPNLRSGLRLAVAFGCCLLAPLGLGHALLAAEKIEVSPLAATLDQPEASLQLLVHQTELDGRKVDLTRSVKYRSENEKIARVDELGLVTPVADGETGVVVDHPGGSTKVAITRWTASAATVQRY